MAIFIFCGFSGKLTKEHVFGKWLKDQFPSQQDTTHTFGKIDWPEHLITRSPRITKDHRTGNARSRYVKVVCKSCNNGWMSEIEDKAKPIILALIARSFRALSPNDQLYLATWACKTAMTAEWLKPNPTKITQIERSNLKDAKSPPANWGVWLADYAGNAWSDLTIFQYRGNLAKSPIGNPRTKLDYVQSTTFGMGNIVFLIVGSSMNGVVEQVDSRLSDGIIQVWPNPIARSILWPPTLTIDDNGANAIANILGSRNIFNQSFNKGANWTFAVR